MCEAIKQRMLTQYDIREILSHEGHKPAYKVAAEFRIDSARVRRLWDGTE